MSEQMRVNTCVDALAPGPVIDPGLNRPRAQAGPPLADKKGIFVAFDQCGSLTEPVLQRFACKPADRNDAILVAFAGYRDGAIAQVDIADIKPGQFR